MSNSRFLRAGSYLALALLLLAPLAPLAHAGDMDKSDDGVVTLTGQLSKDSMGAYVLIEESSGDSIALAGGKDLAALEGARVRVSGTWTENSDGNKVLQVKSVEKAG